MSWRVVDCPQRVRADAAESPSCFSLVCRSGLAACRQRRGAFRGRRCLLAMPSAGESRLRSRDVTWLRVALTDCTQSIRLWFRRGHGGFWKRPHPRPHVSALVSLQISRFDPMPHPPECRRTGKATANSPIGKSLFGICRSLQAIPLPPISELRIRKAGRSGDCQAIPGFPGSPPHALACGLPALGEGDVSRTGDPGRRFVVRWAYVWVTVVRTSTWQPGIRLLLTV